MLKYSRIDINRGKAEMKSFSNKKFADILKDHDKIVDCEFIDCIFEKCKFADCTFINCIFSECSFLDCGFTNIQSKETNMLLSTFINCNIIGVCWANFQSGSFSSPIYKFDKCYLKYNDFEKLSFKKFDFLQSSLIDCFFVNCDLSESNFKSCNLHNTEFSDCDLRKSDLREARGYNINLLSNRIKGAKFSYPDVINLLEPFDIKIEK